MKAKKITERLLTAIMLVVFVICYCYASRCDYEDAVICEMKNNGYYAILSENYPEFTDYQLVEMYISQKSDNECK